jgi:hypothetical protein
VLAALAVTTNLNISYCAIIALAVNTAVFVTASIKLKPVPKTREKIVQYREAYERDI